MLWNTMPASLKLPLIFVCFLNYWQDVLATALPTTFSAANDPLAFHASQVTILGACVGAMLVIFMAFGCASKKNEDGTPADDNQQAKAIGDLGIDESRVSMEANPVYLLKRRQEEERIQEAQEKIEEKRIMEARQSTANRMVGDPLIDEDEQASANISLAERRAKALTQSVYDDSSLQKALVLTTSTPWLHHGIRKGDSMNVLNNHPHKQDGLFLVRAKKQDSGMYALDVLHLLGGKYMVENYLVSRSKTGIFEVDGRLTKSGARALDEVILELHGSSNLIQTPLTRGIPAADVADEDEHEADIET
eukprot:m.104448 g.104448  ORF g.104448 m.104448 type:complete len:306 (+) comp27569_c1_seq1:261-1178(+)